MLSLSRKKDEVVVINGNIRVIVTGIDRGRVMLSFDCPQNIPILREELIREREEKENENRS